MVDDEGKSSDGRMDRGQQFFYPAASTAIASETETTFERSTDEEGQTETRCCASGASLALPARYVLSVH